MSSVLKCPDVHPQIPIEFASQDIARSLNHPIPLISHREDSPVSVTRFKEEFYGAKRPVILRHSNEQWKAFDQWRDLGWWCEQFGHRLVPIEIGRLNLTQQHNGSSQKEQWRESTMTIRDFIHQYIQPDVARCTQETPVAQDNSSIGYLAQHHLFDQLPRLREDFDIPPYCQVSAEAPGQWDHVKMNAWFGTSGTVTSLHFDSYDNFLTQVVGYKYVRLYAPEQSENLYPIQRENGEEEKGHDVTAQNNISPVDVENPDLQAHPNFANAPYLEFILGPRDMLFIPQNWWHYVRSLSPSFSINFWF